MTLAYELDECFLETHCYARLNSWMYLGTSISRPLISAFFCLPNAWTSSHSAEQVRAQCASWLSLLANFVHIFGPQSSTRFLRCSILRVNSSPTHPRWWSKGYPSWVLKWSCWFWITCAVSGSARIPVHPAPFSFLPPRNRPHWTLNRTSEDWPIA